MRIVGRRSLFAVPLAAALVLLPGASGLAADPTIEATGGVYGYYWSPSSAQVVPGGSVSFKSPSGSIPHGVTWSSGPETPKCSNVPINEGKTGWSGSCSFAQAGSYGFYCTVHPAEMKGTVTASSTGSPNPYPPPPYPDPGGPPIQGPASAALKLARSQQGKAVRGSVRLSPAAVGGRLEVELMMARSLLPGPQGAGTVIVGRLVRGALQAERVTFAVLLRRVARRLLEERGRLSLKVRVTIAPPGGKDLVINRSVVVHD
jgi:plastocyanin